MRYDRRYWAMFAVLLMVGAVLAASGCLDGNDDDDDELVIPGDRTGDSLEISGNVNKSMSITIEGMVEMGLVDFQATFVNSVGTTYTANYTGVLLKDILEAAIPDDGVDVVWLTASDGYRAMLFYADVDDDMYIALMEEDEWNDLSDAGTFRLVDTDLPSVYWVRDIVAITPTVSAPIWSGGYTEKQALINVGWIQERATEEVSWQEGEKTRTYTGVPMSVVLDAIGADDTRSDTLGLGTFSNLHDPVDLSVAREDGVLLVDSRGRYIYYQGPDDERVLEIARFYVGSSVSVHGEVSEPYSMDTLALSDNDLIEVSWVDVTYQGQDYVGTPLSWLVAQAAPDPTIDSIMVSAGDGYFAVFPLPDITDTVLAFMLDDTSPIPLEDGPFRIVDNGRSGPFQVSWVVDIEVFSSTPIEASGDVNVTDVLDLGYIASNADVEITYFDGRKDRTYGGLSWDSTLAALDYATWTTQVKLVDADEGSTTWTIGDLLGRTDSGICVDSRGNYVAYNGALEEAFPNIVSIEVS